MDELNPNDLPSGRTLDQALEDAYKHGDAMRLRRRAAYLAPALLVVLAVPVALSVASAQPDQARVQVADDPATTSTTETDAAPTTTTAAAPGATTTTSTKVPAATTTTTAKPPTTTAAPTKACTQGDLSLDVTTDKASYERGVTVNVAARATNRSSAACHDPAVSAYAVVDAADQIVFHAEYPTGEASGSAAALSQGEARQVDLQWNQRVCDTSCNQAPPGTYRIRVRWGSSWWAASGPFEVK
jgi:hypothetical protein